MSDLASNDFFRDVAFVVALLLLLYAAKFAIEGIFKE